MMIIIAVDAIVLLMLSFEQKELIAGVIAKALVSYVSLMFPLIIIISSSSIWRLLLLLSLT